MTEIISGIRPRLKTNRDSFFASQLRSGGKSPIAFGDAKNAEDGEFFRPAAAKIPLKKMADFFRDLPTADAEFSIAQFQSERINKTTAKKLDFLPAACANY